MAVEQPYGTDHSQASTLELVEFARALVEAGVVTDRRALDVVETPWRWGKEFELWSVLQRPREGEPTWETFAGLIWKGEGAVREYLADREEAHTWAQH